ncbi:MAG TPA: hypothetical protein VM510_10590, partial [Caulifigura sp.]|nr:hypothetical protein [Caulifigura sp.]
RQRIANGQQLAIYENGVLVTLSGATPDSEFTFETAPAKFRFTLKNLKYGESLAEADGNVVVDLVPPVLALATTHADEDYPALARAKDGTVYVVYLAFTRGRDFQGERERPTTPGAKEPALGGGPVKLIERPGDLDYLAQPAGGEQLWLQSYKDGKWSQPVAVTDGKLELYRPSVAVGGDGRVWVFYSAHLNADENLDHGNWELQARSFAPDGSKPSDVMNLSQAAGTDFLPAATTDSDGNVWLAWIGARGDRFHVFSAHQEAGKFTAATRVSDFTGNEWEPAIAAGANGRVAIAWDTFDKGDYDVYVATRDGIGKPLGKPEAVAGSLAFEVRPTLAYDKDSRLWIAYEYSGDQWGKDFGALKKKGIPLYQTGRSLQMKVRDTKGSWFAPADVMDAMPDVAPIARGNARRPRAAAANPAGRSPVQSIAPTYPRLSSDAAGQIWLAFRGKPGGNWRVGVGSVWCEYVTTMGADGWANAAWVPHSNNILDNRPALVSLGDNRLLAVFSGDGRGEIDPLDAEDSHLPGSSDDADVAPKKEAAAAAPAPRRGGRRNNPGGDPNNNLMYARIDAAGFQAGNGAPVLKPIEAEEPAKQSPDIADEREDVQRMRDYRVTLGNETLRIWRGEFHRHTELSPDGGGDGGLLDMWRYAIDAASMDWIGDGDHDYGNGREYSWWTTQKAVTLFTLPGSFVPIYSYERSVRYPEGHRNCMFARRGIRSLPRMPISAESDEGPAPDTNLLYMYLHFFDGLCASHTSATDMGTDWRNNDPVVEPFVEIYQGDRNNYERPDAPRSAVTEAKLKQSTPEKESLGGWRPKGFVNLALQKGYRLAFECSSDHISTHLSYCNVLVKEPTREGLLDAIRKRRVYGATDNIIADVRCKAGGVEHFMGEEFTMTGAPTLDVHIIGCRNIAKITIIKDDVEVYAAEPKKKDVHFQWTDPKPTTGRTSYYYVRGEQEPDLEGATAGELVWASPMWIQVK